MKKRLGIIIAVACAAIMAFALVGCSESETEESSNSGTSTTTTESGPVTESETPQGTGATLRFVTGGESGTYYAYGTVLAQYATNHAGMTVNALSGAGSQANIQSLEDGDAELAFCQTDVATYAYQGTSLFAEEGPVQDFSVVAALYEEQVQIVTCDETIKTVSDLAGRTVSIGAANSGVYFNAIDVLAAYGISESEINPVYQDFADSADSLKNGQIDAAFIVAGAPTTAITDLSASKQAYLVSLDDEHISDLMTASPYYAEAVIPGGTYSGIEEDVTTVAVLAVILAADSVSEEDVYAFTASLFEGAEAQPEAHSKYEELNLDTAASITSVPYHEGAIKYYEEKGISIKTA